MTAFRLFREAEPRIVRRMILHPFHLLVIALASWMNRQQQDVIEYLREKDRVLREQIGEKRLRFTDAQRCRLAAVEHACKARLLLYLHTRMCQAL